MTFRLAPEPIEDIIIDQVTTTSSSRECDCQICVQARENNGVDCSGTEWYILRPESPPRTLPSRQETEHASQRAVDTYLRLMRESLHMDNNNDDDVEEYDTPKSKVLNGKDEASCVLPDDL